MAHDQLFKELLRAFLREFMELFFPQIAARLDWSQVTFPDKEVFTDVPEGSVRRADTVALVPKLDGDPELVLIHVETQSERRSDVRFRVFEYYALLRLRYKLPVFPSRFTSCREQAVLRTRRIRRVCSATPFLRFGMPPLVCRSCKRTITCKAAIRLRLLSAR